MDTMGGLNRMIAYIEAHLDEALDNAALARVAGCSQWHLQRMFPFIAGIPLSEYIRRRRLTAAAFALQRGEDKVIDLAAKYGYESPTAFNRAFQAVHGISPSAARRQGAALKAYPVMSFHLSVKGESQMEYQIVERSAFALTGVSRSMALVDGEEDFAAINAMWADLDPAWAERMLSRSNGALPGLVVVSSHNGGDRYDYSIGITVDKVQPEEEGIFIPAATWAIFTSVGPLPEAMVDTWRRIFTDWFPHSGTQCAPGPTLELYDEGDTQDLSYRCFLWLPIERQTEAAEGEQEEGV